MLTVACKAVGEKYHVTKILKWLLIFGTVFNVVFLLTYVPISWVQATRTYNPETPTITHEISPIVSQHTNSISQHTNIISQHTNTPSKQLESVSQRQRCQPHQHVYYLKTHKTGSTTMYSIFAEYSRVHDLLPLMPRGVHINQSPPVRDYQLLLPKSTDYKSYNLKFDMVFNHHVYSPPIFDHLYDDTVKITTIREPFKQFVSSFTYFKREGMAYLKRIPGEDPMMELLKNRNKYEAKGYTSYTNNRQSMDLGFDVRHSFNDTDYTTKFLLETEKRFDLVLITDYFHESLVIMKRQLRWRTQDILYFSKLAQRKKKTEPGSISPVEEMYRKLHATLSQADTALYLHFLAIFEARMKTEEGLAEEVAEFEGILEKVRTYCDHVSRTVSILNIPAGRWSDSIQIVPNKCKWMKINEVHFTAYLQKRQNTILSLE